MDSNFNSKQSGRPRERTRSRSRSPREWKRPERHASDRDNVRGGRELVRLFVSNLPYEMRWQDLKDLFREKVGVAEISYVELYEDQNGKPSGSGVVEVKGRDAAEKAIETLHRYEIKGRHMVVREEYEKDRQRYARRGPPPGPNDFDRGREYDMDRFPGNGGGPSLQGLMSMGGGGSSGMMGGGGGANVLSMLGGGGGGLTSNNLLGANPGMQLLEMLGIQPQLITNQVFVANLDYKVTQSKLEEVFRIAGNVIEVELKVDKDGRSRGMGTVRFEHPMEAVQCIALFNQQFLFERQIAVRMDKWVDPVMQEIPKRLPVGLKGLGAGFGSGGQPLMNIAQISNTMTLNALAYQLTVSNSVLSGNVSALSSLMAGAGIGGGGGGLQGLGNLAGNASLLSTLASALGGGGASAGSGGLSSVLTGSGNMMGMAGDILGNPGNSGSMMGGGGSGGNPSNYPGLGGSGGGGFGGGMQDSRGGGGGMDLGYSGSSGNVGSGYVPGDGIGSSLRQQSFDFDVRSSNFDRPPPMSFERNMERKDFKERMNVGESSGGGMGSLNDVTSIFVKNIPFSYNWQDLLNRFKHCGDVRTANVKMDNGRSRGIGTVSFYSPEDARRAVNMMNNAVVDGRQLEVRLDRLA